MPTPFRSLRGAPFALDLSADHEARLTAWLRAQPARVNRRRARKVVLRLAHTHANKARINPREAFEVVMYQLEMEAERAVPA